MRKSKASVTLFTAVWTSYKVSFSLPQRLLQVQAHTSNLRLYVKYCRSALSKYFCDAVLFYGAEQYLTIVDYTGIIYRNTWCHWLENVCVCVFLFCFFKIKTSLNFDFRISEIYSNFFQFKTKTFIHCPLLQCSYYLTCLTHVHTAGRGEGSQT